MDFKTAFAHYRVGTASPEEITFIEAELEKSKIIAEYLDQQWESLPEEPAPVPEDLKSIRLSLKRHDRKTVIKCIALIAALGIFIMCIAFPLMESIIWNPKTSSFDDSFSDLQTTISTYSELFLPGAQASTLVSKSGFLSYDLRITLQDTDKQHLNRISGKYQNGRLSLEQSLLGSDINQNPNIVFRNMIENEITETMDTLSRLPEYVRVRAAVKVPQDLSMEEMLTLWQTCFAMDPNQNVSFLWAAIRHGPPDENWPICGMDPFGGGVYNRGVDSAYPALTNYRMTPESLEQHFKSLLRYNADQQNMGHGLPVWTNKNYYESVLNYVNDNGVYCYGFVVSGSPEALYQMTASGIFSQICIMDAWIDID